MISVFEADVADDFWPQLVTKFRDVHRGLVENQKEATAGRGGGTLELLPAVLQLSQPQQRWMYSREPALNPAFALAEIIWILAGRRDSAFLNHWNPALPNYAGEGPVYHGAYGWRLKNEHGIDQLQRAYEVLRSQPESRQVVLQIWKPSLDLPEKSGIPVASDIPCNICALLKVRDGQLHWTQVMRSNDVFRGLPYNLIQWTTLQEVFAGWLELKVGLYTHLSDSLHIYERDWPHVSANPAALENRQLVPANDDNLALSRDEFLQIFPRVEQRAYSLLDPLLQRKSLEDLTQFHGCPQAYQNILCVLAADTARRHGWIEEVQGLIERCTNPAFCFLWARWDERRSRRGV